MLKKISAAVLLAFGLFSFNFAQNFPQNQDNEDEDIENFMNEFEQNSENKEKAQKETNGAISSWYVG